MQFSEFSSHYVSIQLNDCQNPMPVLEIMPKQSDNNEKVILVIQEIFGINPSLRETCAEYASMGYRVLCPDLFHRFKAGISLTDSDPDELQQAFNYFNAFNVDTAMSDIQAVIDYIKNTLHVKKIGAVGYCLGGFLAYLTICRTEIDACVSYYGVNIQNYLTESHRIKSPLLLHIAALDEFVSPDNQAIILEHFKQSSFVTCEHYKGVQHAFARVNGIHYNHEMAILANKNTHDFFKKNL